MRPDGDDRDEHPGRVISRPKWTTETASDEALFGVEADHCWGGRFPEDDEEVFCGRADRVE